MNDSVSNIRRRERGSQVIEMGLMMLPFMAFIFLMLDISWAVFVKSSLQHAVREGVRYGITSRCKSGMHHDASIRDVVRKQSMGLLAGAEDSAISIKYYIPDTLAETNLNAGGNLIEVSVERYSLNPLGAIMRSTDPLVFTVRASDRMQPSPGGIAPQR